jgi:N-acylglucosamine-6-phosphate 2-epimerase
MTDLQSKIQNLKSRIEGGLIVSCQATADSPLAKPEIIAAFAQTAAQNGAVAVRIDAPVNIRAVKAAVSIPVLGIYKIVSSDSEVYITPTFDAARQIAAAGTDLIALDATRRPRPERENLSEIVRRIHDELGLPVMADVATGEEGLHAERAGCDFVGTTLSGYTPETAHKQDAPDFELVEFLAEHLSIPLVCEGRLRQPSDVAKAFELGAFTVVVGNSITGIDFLVRSFADKTPAARQR